MGELRLAIGASLAGERLDRAVAIAGGIERAFAQQLVDDGGVLVDGRVEQRRSRRLRAGELLEATWPDPAAPPAPEGAPVVCYEDDDVAVIDKPAGLIVHRTHLRDVRPSVADWALERWPSLRALPGDPLRRGLVHRLDRGTSGLMVIALSAGAYESLRRAVHDHEVERRYRALVVGVPPQAARIEAPLGRDLRDLSRVAVVSGGRDARTQLTVVWHGRDTSLVELTLETGRTHQIRVHLSAIGHPIVGDEVYGVPYGGLERPFLHATALAFEHPTRPGRVEVTSELPEDLGELAARARTEAILRVDEGR